MIQFLKSIEALWPQVISFGTALTGAFLVMMFFWTAGVIVAKIFMRLAAKDADRRDAFILLAKAIKTSLVIFGIVSALGTIGVDVTAIIAGMGLTGFALGFALKDMLSSAVAGFMILINRPFSAGDRIKVGDSEGIVETIDLRYTTLADNGKHFLIPNSAVLSSTVTVVSRKNPK